MPVKLAVKRFTSGTSYIGDVVGVYPATTDLGHMVEPKGGAYSIIIVSDAELDTPDIAKLTAPYMIKNPAWVMGDASVEEYLFSEKYDRKYYLNPVTSGDIFNELLTTGRYTATLAELQSFIRERTDG